MTDRRSDGLLLPAHAVKAGLQDVLHAELSRRQVLGGLAGSSALIGAALPAAAEEFTPLWWDIRFDLARDGQVLTVAEICVCSKPDAPDPQPKPKRPPSTPTRRDECRWRVPAAAFGPAAWFDMVRPTDPVTSDKAPERRIIVRRAAYGSRKNVTLWFRFARLGGGPAGRWTIACDTDLWTAGSRGAERAGSPPVAFAAFLKDQRLRESLGARRVGATIQQMFDNRLSLSEPAPAAFDVAFDKHLVWHVTARGTGGLAAFSRQVIVPDLSLAWHRVVEDSENEKPEKIDKERKDEFFFTARAGIAHDSDVPAILNIGDRRKHHVRIAPRKKPGSPPLELQARAEPSPLRPIETQSVVMLRIGSGEITIADARTVISGPIHAVNLALCDTVPPGGNGAVRTVLWGDALGPEPPPPGSEPTAAAREIVSPIGRLFVGPPAIETLAGREPPKAPDTAPQPETNREPGACEVEGGEQAPSADRKTVSRLFQIANGDRGGAREATVFVVHDEPPGGAPGGLRRVLIDLSLVEACVAVPDASYSRLCFANTDLRLVYEDGRTLAELPAREYPNSRPSSFVWVGPPSSSGADALRASLDLSRARLACARDYDLVKLTFRFHDLVLDFTAAPSIRPAREDCRVIQREGGLVEDSRPVLVAEFGPQHVMEQAIFRPQPPPLPDHELTEAIDLGGGKTVEPGRDALLAHLKELTSEAERTSFRKVVGAKKAAADPKSPFGPFAQAYAEEAASIRNLPEDQRVYIGPFALDPDAMALARKVQRRTQHDAIGTVLDGTLNRLETTRQTLETAKKLLPITGAPDPNDNFRNAQRNEALLEQQEPFYLLFRQFWRDNAVRTRVRSPGTGNESGDDDPLKPSPYWRTEYFLKRNRPSTFVYEDNAESNAREEFVKFVLAEEPIDGLMEARLSGPSRLAFRLNCQPVGGLDAEAAGLPDRRPSSPDRPGSGAAAYAPIPFTFEALTDWSRHEPAVTQRARKLFTALPSGLVPPLGNRAAEADDPANLVFQGITKGPTTAARRMTEIRSAISKAPTELETAIEIPARLILSPAQDAVWRTNRCLPSEVLLARAQESIPVIEPPTPIALENGRSVATPEAQPDEKRGRLWSARLVIDEVPPDLRVVASPDLRPMALDLSAPQLILPPTGSDGQKPPQRVPRLPGHGAPPPGPYAPWFLGPEQTDSGRLTAREVNASLPERDRVPDPCPAVAPNPDKRSRLIRWLCDRLGITGNPAVQDHLLFRTSLDANDRHQLVLLSSAYGLPVIGKRQATGDDVEAPGGLVADSGQIEPGEFALLDARNDHAIYRPMPLAVQELVLTSLGGSFLHDTTFKPAAGADDLWHRKIFDGFSIERWQHEIVLGRDIRAEVVYKGYLFPFGHKASLIKLTERVFLRTTNAGIKAILRQRLYLRCANPAKPFPAVGQPHRGRLWCGSVVTLITTRSPDLIDPTLPATGQDNATGTHELANGRIVLEGPGLAFWPRTDLTPGGLLRFDLEIDKAATTLPLLFLDNIAATNATVLKGVAEYYNKLPEGLRRLDCGGQKIRYAPETKPGDTSYATKSIVVRVQGREKTSQATWIGDLTEYETTGVLEGAEQPSFYPAVQSATVRLEQAERFSGGGELPVEVQYDGHYVRHGFVEDAGQGDRRSRPTAEQENPLEVFLNLRRVVKLDMGSNGDRAAAVARPQSRIIALSRKKGPLGGDETVWWQTGPGGGFLKERIDDQDDKVTTVINNEANLVSLAAYFNGKAAPPAPATASPVSTATPAAPAAEEPRAPAVAPADKTPPSSPEALRQLQIVQSYFSGDAKLLGTIKLKALMRLLKISPDNLPVLNEIVEYGTAAADNLAADVKTRVLSPLQNVIRRLREQWSKLDAALKKLQPTLPGRPGKPIALAAIYPEIDTGLAGVEQSLAGATASEDGLALAAKLAELHESARRLVHGLAIVAANPVERLQDAVTADFQGRLADISNTLGQIAKLGPRLMAILDSVRWSAPEVIAAWIIDHIASPSAAGAGPDDKDGDPAARVLADELSLVIRPVDLLAVARGLLGDALGGIGRELGDIAQAFAEATRLSGKTLLQNLVRDVVREVLTTDKPDIPALIRTTLQTFLQDFQKDLTKATETAKNAVAGIAKDTKDAALAAAKIAIAVQLDAFKAYVEDNFLWDNAEAILLELAALDAAARRAVAVFEHAQAVRRAIENGRPETVLKEAAVFAQDVLGVLGADVAGPLDGLRAKLTAIGEGAASQLSHAAEALQLEPLQIAILVREISACARYRAEPKADPNPLPVRDDNGKPVGSIAPLQVLASALDDLAMAAATNKDIETALKKDDYKTALATALGDGRYGRMVAFTADATVLLQGDGTAAAPGLATDLRGLYCTIVDIVVALRALGTQPAGGKEPDRAAVERWATDARHLRHTIAELGDRLASIMRQTAAFAEHNSTIAGGLAGAALAATVPGLPEDVRDAFKPLAETAARQERDIAEALRETLNVAIRLLTGAAVVAADAAEAARQAAAQADAAVKTIAAVSEITTLEGALKRLREQLETVAALQTITTPVKSIAELRAAPIKKDGSTAEAFFRSVKDGSAYQPLAARLRDTEAGALAAWRALDQRLRGLPDTLKGEIEKEIFASGSGAIAALADAYAAIRTERAAALEKLDPIAIFRTAARRALLVPADGCPIADPKQELPKLLDCDGLATDYKLLNSLKAPLDATQRQAFMRLLRGWQFDTAAPLVIVAQARDIATDLLRGHVFSVIDLGAFRDQIEDAIAGLIPTKATLNYDFNAVINEEPDDQAIFQPKKGQPFRLEVRAAVDLRTQQTSFRARGHIGAFDIKLIGGLVDALTLQFGGASFVLERGAKPHFEVAYTNFVIGRDLEFAKKLESYLLPAEGNGVFVQPLTRGPGIEAGYGINLGTLSVGGTSFFNVTLNVSAELPFDSQDALFKVSLGRRLAPFSMSVLPFAGSGYFAILAAANGVRGFEASFEFGGGGSLAFGPLTAQARIQVGVFVSVLRAAETNVTTIYGTFFAGGSASIWIFHFATSLYVRLGTASNGAMYGEAVYTFSFSLGLADYDFSITAVKNQEAIGSGNPGRAEIGPRDGGEREPRVRLAALGDTTTMTDAVPAGMAGTFGLGGEACDAASPVWSFERAYFDTSLLSPIELP